MKSTHLKTLCVLVAATWLAACSSQKTLEDSSVVDAEPAPEVTPEPVPVEPVDPVASLAKTVYFDFDVAELTMDTKDTLKEHAMALSADSSLSVTLEGHCDERGTVEYNLALGERRAQAVANYLMANGVARTQIQTISFGEEQPVALSHNEAAWSQNRRVEIKY